MLSEKIPVSSILMGLEKEKSIKIFTQAMISYEVLPWKTQFSQISPEKASLINNLMGPQNKKPIRFLLAVTSHETPRGKLHQNFSQNSFTRNPFIYRFLQKPCRKLKKEILFQLLLSYEISAYFFLCLHFFTTSVCLNPLTHANKLTK